MIAGFIAFSFGLLIALHQTIIAEDIMSFIPDLRVAEFVGVLLQIFGIFLFVTGLLMSISSIVENRLRDERRSLIQFTASVERALNVLASQSQIGKKTEASKTAQKCKYCGAELTEGDVFCPSCGKSQK